MDISQVRYAKKQRQGETNYAPVPQEMLKSIVKSGLQICCYYDNIPSEPKPSSEPIRRFPYYCISHMIEGEGFLSLEGKKHLQTFSPGHAVIACPGTFQNYGSLKGFYVEDSICFSGAAADALREAGVLSDRVIYIGLERRLFPVIKKIREPGLISALEANAMLISLLIEVHRERLNVKNEGSRHNLQKLLTYIDENPGYWWTVEEMSEYCNISSNYLRQLFYEETGMSPKQYIDQLKMRHASEMLRAGKMKVAEIASSLGFKDPFHFIRRFSNLTGTSPRRYREYYNMN